MTPDEIKKIKETLADEEEKDPVAEHQKKFQDVMGLAKKLSIEMSKIKIEHSAPEQKKSGSNVADALEAAAAGIRKAEQGKKKVEGVIEKVDIDSLIERGKKAAATITEKVEEVRTAVEAEIEKAAEKGKEATSKPKETSNETTDAPTTEPTSTTTPRPDWENIGGTKLAPDGKTIIDNAIWVPSEKPEIEMAGPGWISYSAPQPVAVEPQSTKQEPNSIRVAEEPSLPQIGEFVEASGGRFAGIWNLPNIDGTASDKQVLVYVARDFTNGADYTYEEAVKAVSSLSNHDGFNGEKGVPDANRLIHFLNKDIYSGGYVVPTIEVLEMIGEAHEKGTLDIDAGRAYVSSTRPTPERVAAIYVDSQPPLRASVRSLSINPKVKTSVLAVRFEPR